MCVELLHLYLCNSQKISLLIVYILTWQRILNHKRLKHIIVLCSKARSTN